MKERIRRFYEEHQNGCDTTIAALAALGTLFAVHKARGHRIDAVDLWQNDEGTQLITVRTKNGKTDCFSKKPA